MSEADFRSESRANPHTKTDQTQAGSASPVLSLPVTPGRAPAAKVSPEKDEIQIIYKIDQPKLTFLKQVEASLQSGSNPVTLKSIDDRNLLVGYEDGTLRVIDLASNFQVSRQYKLDAKVGVIEPVQDDDGLYGSMQILCGLGSPDHCIVSLEL